MKSSVAISLVGLVGSTIAGCGPGTLAKRALSEMVGAKSDAEIVPGTGADNFARFNGVQIRTPRTDLGGLVSTEFRSELMTALREQLTGDDDAPFRGGGSPLLTIDPVIQWYHRGGIGGLMPERFAVVLFWMKSEGQDVGRVQIVTKSEASRTGDRDLATDMAEELRGFFEERGKKRD